MRLTEFARLLDDEFGPARGRWIADSHVLPRRGATASELVERGVDLKVIWEELCAEFDVPEERQLGRDRPGW
ncbi:DUF3046 domain-containing protein [Corynebacterium uterequi]|nr:DUF3046 domain-containing protein [Corynebacterium uterequi]